MSCYMGSDALLEASFSSGPIYLLPGMIVGTGKHTLYAIGFIDKFT